MAKKPMSSDKKLLDRLLSSDAKAELLVLFHKNPGLIDTIEGVARRIGRTGAEIDSDVRDLVNLGTLEAKKFGELETIRLDRNKDKNIQASLESYFKRLKK